MRNTIDIIVQSQPVNYLFLLPAAFRISRDINPNPAISSFRDLNQEVFLLAAVGSVQGTDRLCFYFFSFYFVKPFKDLLFH